MPDIRRTLCLLPLGLALAGCATHGVAVQAAATTPPASAAGHAPIPLKTLRPGLYTAGQPAEADWTTIAGRGVGLVINLRPPAEMHGRDEAEDVRSAGMAYAVIPIADAGDIGADTARQLSVLLKNATGPVLLHCASANRAGGLLAVSAAHDGLPAEAALERGRKAGMKSTEPRVRALLGLPPAE